MRKKQHARPSGHQRAEALATREELAALLCRASTCKKGSITIGPVAEPRYRSRPRATRQRREAQQRDGNQEN